MKLVLWAVILAAFPRTALAAVIQRINEDRTRVIVDLSYAELAKLEENQEVLVEVGKERLVLQGRVGPINVPKKTAVLIFAAADDRLAKRQVVRFLSAFWNSPLSPEIFSYAQYHQFSRSSMDASLGGFGSYAESKESSARAETQTVGGRLALHGYLLFHPRYFGGAFTYERRMATVSARGTQDGANELGRKTKTEVLINKIKPGFWAELQPQWRLGLHHDYTAMERTVRADDRRFFAYDYGKTVATVIHYDESSEMGAHYVDKLAFTAVDVAHLPDGTTQEHKDRLRLPAELRLFYRRASTPRFAWGSSLGYVFFEREIEPGRLEPKPDVLDLLRLRFGFEHRLSSGSKFDWALYYDGAETTGLLEARKGVNTVGVNLGYQFALMPGYVAGWSLDIEGGERIVEHKQLNANTGAVEPVSTITKGGGAVTLAYIRYEFDADRERGARE